MKFFRCLPAQLAFYILFYFTKFFLLCYASFANYSCNSFTSDLSFYFAWLHSFTVLFWATVRFIVCFSADWLSGDYAVFHCVCYCVSHLIISTVAIFWLIFSRIPFDFSVITALPSTWLLHTITITSIILHTITNITYVRRLEHFSH